MQNRRGQNVIEYILVVTAVVLVFLAVFIQGHFRGTVEKSINAIVPAIDQGTSSLKFSQ